MVCQAHRRLFLVSTMIVQHMGSSQSSTQAIIDHGIQSEHDEDTILQYLNINDPKLEAIIRAYIHVRKENTERNLSEWRTRNQYWCC